MNGMKIDGKTWKIGSLVKIAVVQGQKIMLGFWGWEATLVLGGEQKEVTTSALPMIVIESSTPASSAYGSRFADEEPEDEREEQEMLVDPTPQRSVSPAESELSALSPSSPASRRVPFSDPTSPAQALVESLSLGMYLSVSRLYRETLFLTLPVPFRPCIGNSNSDSVPTSCYSGCRRSSASVTSRSGGNVGCPPRRETSC